MDERVLRAMAKWPDVPEVFGWLGLDVHGRWLLRGEPIANPTVLGFIGRNYLADRLGRWYFQNGPQRVFVELAYTPWVFSVFPEGLRSQTGEVAVMEAVYMDEAANLIFDTPLGPGALAPRDLPEIAGKIHSGANALDETKLRRALANIMVGAAPGLSLEWLGRSQTVGAVLSHRLPERFGFVQCPTGP